MQRLALISVIMATYNTPKEYLERAINSILTQSFHDFEFIIIDDCSSSNDQEVIKSFKDSRINFYRNEKNLGLAASLNRGLGMANGKYIARMDADDISLRNRLEIQYKFLEENKHIDVVSSFAKQFGERNNFIISPYIDDKEIDIQLLFGNTICHPTVMFRKEFMKKNDLKYNENFKSGQDYELWTRCLKVGKFSIIPKVTLYYRTHNKQISVSKKDGQIRNTQKIYMNQLRDLGFLGSENEINLHYEFCNSSSCKAENIKDFIEWGNNLIERNKEIKRYDDRLLRRCISYTLFKKLIRTIRQEKLHCTKEIVNSKADILSLLKVNTLFNNTKYVKYLLKSKIETSKYLKSI